MEKLDTRPWIMAEKEAETGGQRDRRTERGRERQGQI
jgi:hypothetical protein